jgi:hypothetical protein
MFEFDSIRPDNAIPIGTRADEDDLGMPSEDEAEFHLPDQARTKHVYIAGKTQSGKSTLMLQMAAMQIGAGRGVGVIDPHGDLAHNLLAAIPDHRRDDTIYLDADNPVPIDFLSYEAENDREALVGDTIFLLQRFAGWGPRMDAILRNLLYTLLEAREVSFLDIYHFLVNEKRRAEILKRVTDEDLLRYWRDSFPKPDAIEPILSRMTTFVRSPSLNTFMGTPNAQLNIYDIMQDGKVLIVNLVKSGRESGDLLGSLIVSKIEQAALRRHKLPKPERKPFYLYADEFQRFQTASFDHILSEAGKFGICLTMANQFVDQLDPKILSSIHGNVSTLMLFRLDERDARHFSQSIRIFDKAKLFKGGDRPKIMDDYYSNMAPNRLVNLPTGTYLYKSAEGNSHFLMFSDVDLPNAGNAEYVKKRTVEKYSCDTKTKMVQLEHEPTAAVQPPPEDDIQPTGRPENIPPHEN